MGSKDAMLITLSASNIQLLSFYGRARIDNNIKNALKLSWKAWPVLRDRRMEVLSRHYVIKLNRFTTRTSTNDGTSFLIYHTYSFLIKLPNEWHCQKS